ncbi:MAG: phosphoribosylaminoimidazolesuccinocarboxamide synthase, partial [Flavitalea sp.]
MKDGRFPGQTNFYRGKVRDVYTIRDKWLVMIASDRISAFDVILPKPIPYKGQVLNQIAAYMLNATKDICLNWLLETPAPTAAIGKKCVPFRIEMVVRGNLTGHAWRTYSAGVRTLCGVVMPEGMKENDFFPNPIITPSTKADEGHDEDISKEEIISKGLATSEDWKVLENYTLQLFERGKKL